MQKCSKLRDRSPSQIASFLLRKYNSEKVKAMIEEFELWGFTKENLCRDRENLFRFLVLVAYDRQPFDRPDYYAVWNKSDQKSVCSVLEKAGLFNIDHIRTLSEKEIELLLRQCIAHGYHLHNSNPANGGIGTNYAKTIKKLSEITDDIIQLLPKLQTGYDVLNLHRKLCTIHGIKNTIASKFIMYTVRELGIGNVPYSQLEPIAFYLFGEWHNKKWAKRLEDPVLGGRPGLAEQLMEHMKSDPIALDYLWQLDRDYCTLGKCQQCDL